MKRECIILSKKTAFKVQIIVLCEIVFEEHPWLAALAKNLNAEDIRELFRQEERLEDREDKDNAAAVREVILFRRLSKSKKL